MSQKIESDKLFIKDVFQKWYRIPEYQRPYVWGDDQVGELLEDVRRARESNPQAQYFLGSMVLQKNQRQTDATSYEEYDLLDGQQRLTTLFLITAVIRDLTPASNGARKKTCQDSLYQMANPDDNVPERSRIVFDIRDEVRDFVQQFVQKDGGTLMQDQLKLLAGQKDGDTSVRHMAGALLRIHAFFAAGTPVDAFFPFLRSNVLMIYVAAEGLEDAFHLFTVMNNRGIKLRNSDILKAQNLKALPKADRAAQAKRWEATENHFGEEFDVFLSHIRTILVKQKASVNLLQEYEENVYHPREFDRSTQTYHPKPPLLTKGKATFDFIDRHYRHYLALFDQDHFSVAQSYEIDNQLTLMRLGLEAEHWIAPLLAFYDRHGNQRLMEFLRLLDNKVSADWMAALTPTDRVQNANAIIQTIESVSDLNTLFADPVFQFHATGLRSVFDGEVYGRRFARYLLLKLDLLSHGHTTRFQPPPTLSIEHILPQTPDVQSQWRKDFTDPQREEWTDKLGNLIFLSRRKNSSQGNLDFTLKKEKYFKSNIELFSHSVRVFQSFSTWTLNDLSSNHATVVQQLRNCYGLP